MRMLRWGDENIRIEKMKEVLSVVAVLCVIWGLFGLVGGDGFIGGIGKQFSALFQLIKIALE